MSFLENYLNFAPAKVKIMLVRISAISYLNTLPFVYGLMNHPVSEKIELRMTTPEEAARTLIDGTSDIGIVPSAVIPQLKNGRIISEFCIAADTDVASVLLCSGKPVEQIDRIYLDTESMTSVLLARILCRKYWKIDPEFAKFNFSSNELDPSESYVLIGDKAMLNAHKFNFIYDLAAEWIKFKKMPFVFACWVANKKLSSEFKEEFNDALRLGLNNIDKALTSIPHKFDYQIAYNYLTKNISFNLSPDKREGLSEFWCLALEELKSKVRWFDR